MPSFGNRVSVLVWLLLAACGMGGLAPQPLAICRFPPETGVPAVQDGRPDVKFVYELGDETGARLARLAAGMFARMTEIPFLTRAVTAAAETRDLFCDYEACPRHVVAVGALAGRLDPYPPRGEVVRTRRVSFAGRQLWLLQGEGPLQQAYAAYRFLHGLGVRFYHPRETYVPLRRQLALPAALEKTERPAYDVRGWHIETRVPTPAARAFLGGKPEPMARAAEVLDWLVANGQSFVQWTLPATWSAAQDAHFRALVAAARARGLSAGALLLSGPRDAPQEAAARVEAAAAVGFDTLAAGLETPLLTAKDRHAAEAALAAALAKAAALGVQVYRLAGNDPEAGEPVAGYPETGLLVAGGYLDDLFSAGDGALSNRRLGLLADASPHRPAAYFSYVSVGDDFDVNVPAFLPAYWYARWRDLQQLRSLPHVSAHIASDTGWEWAYWTNAAVLFAASWNPQREFAEIVEDVFAPVGRNTCGQVTETLARLAVEQRSLAVEGGRAPFFTGQSYLHEGLLRAGVPMRPLRPEIGAVAADARLAAVLAEEVVPELEAFVQRWSTLERGLFPAIPRVDAPARPFLQELVDSIVVSRLYLLHTVALLEGAVAAQRGDFAAAEAALQQARDQTSTAGLIVSAREPLYRYPAAELAGMYGGPDGFPHGYLYSVRTLSLWTREETLLANLLAKRGLSD